MIAPRASQIAYLPTGRLRRLATALLLLTACFAPQMLWAQTGPGGVGNASGTSGQPENILWLRGDAGITTSGSTVTEWADQSGNANDVSEAGSAPALTSGGLNGIDVVTFNGSAGQYL